jgi:hypothetical protein
MHDSVERFGAFLLVHSHLLLLPTRIIQIRVDTNIRVVVIVPDLRGSINKISGIGPQFQCPAVFIVAEFADPFVAIARAEPYILLGRTTYNGRRGWRRSRLGLKCNSRAIVCCVRTSVVRRGSDRVSQSLSIVVTAVAIFLGYAATPWTCTMVTIW